MIRYCLVSWAAYTFQSNPEVLCCHATPSSLRVDVAFVAQSERNLSDGEQSQAGGSRGAATILAAG